MSGDRPAAKTALARVAAAGMGIGATWLAIHARIRTSPDSAPSPAATPAARSAAGDAAAASRVADAARASDRSRGQMSNPNEDAPPTHFTRVALHEHGAMDVLAFDGAPILVECGAFRSLDATWDAGPVVPIAPQWPLSCSSIFAVDHERAFAVAGGQLRSIDIASGKLEWFAPPAHYPQPDSPVPRPSDPRLAGDPILVGETVVYEVFDFTGSEYDADLAAGLDTRTGQVAWIRVHLEAPIVSDGQTVFAAESTATESTLVALDPATGALRWSAPLVMDRRWAFSGADLTAGAGRVALIFPLYGSDSEATELLFFDAATGAPLGSRSFDEPEKAFLRNNFRKIRFAGGNLYLYGAESLQQIDPTTGATRWSVPGTFRQVARGRDAVFALEGEMLHIFAPDSGEELGSIGVAGRDANHEYSQLRVIETAAGELVVAADPEREEVALFRRGPHELEPRAKTLDLTVLGAKHPEAMTLVVAGQPVTFDRAGHWRGTVTGRGRRSILSTEDPDLRFKWPQRPREQIEPVVFDFESPAPEEKFELTLHFDQACAPLDDEYGAP